MEAPRPHDKIHASDLFMEHEFCPRERAFMDLGLSKASGSFIGTSQRITFQHGRDMEWRLRNEWLRPYALGHWSCMVCGHLHQQFCKAPTHKCPSCGWQHWEYSEVRVSDPVSGVSGGVDVFLGVGKDSHYLVEVKSMDKDEFRKLSAPLAEHKARTSLYLYLTQSSTLPWKKSIHKTGVILYTSKSFGFKDTTLKAAGIKDAPFSPFKEFRVPMDPSLFVSALNRAEALTKWREMLASKTPTWLPCGICSSGLSKRAQSCSAISPCWSGTFPATITWREKGAPRHANKPIIVGREL